MSDLDPEHRRIAEINAGTDAIDINVRIQAILDAAGTLHSAGANLAPLGSDGQSACRSAADGCGSAPAADTLHRFGGTLGGWFGDVSAVCTNLAHVLASCADAYTRADTTVVPDPTLRPGRPW